MPPALNREEYYWRNGRLHSEMVRRSSTHSRWPRRYRSELVFAIEDTGSELKITYGPQAHPMVVARAFTRYKNLECDPNAPDIGQDVPPGLLSQVTSACADAVAKLIRQYKALANEERMTGLFTGDMNAVSFRHDGWEAQIFIQGFSAETKEPVVGGDSGAVVDIRNSRGRVVKGFFAQAKRVEKMPANLLMLPDMINQMEAMQAVTCESYALLYGPREVEFRHAQDSGTSLSVSTMFSDVVGCRRGDRGPEVIAEALHRELVMEVAIAGPGATWPYARQRRRY